MDSDDDADPVPKAHGTCPACKRYGEVIQVRCLGCMKNFPRCVICYHTATACSQECKEQHRKKLATFFSPGGPKIGGAGDVAI